MALDLRSTHPVNPRSWTQTVDEYLASNGISYTTATPLAGGHSAYVWRIDGYYHNDKKKNRTRTAEPCVLKFAEEAAKGAPEYKVDAQRMRFESRALRSGPVARACEAEPSVQVPRVLETTDRALLMSWGGEVDLRSAYIDQRRRAFDVAKVGSRLGRWLASMHNAGLEDDEIRGFENNTLESFVASEHSLLRETMLRDGLGVEVAESAVERLRSPTGPKTLVAWDFRPMNTLLRFSDDSKEPGLTVVDWEVSGYGCPMDDLKLWMAEALVLEAEHGICKRIVPSFLSAYRHQANKEIITEDFVCDLALAVGSMLLFLVPSGLWTSEEAKIEFWKAKAMQFIRAGRERDVNWLAESEFAPLLVAL